MNDGDLNESERGEWRKKVESDLSTVKDDVGEVKDAIIGNSKYRRLGLMERMDKVEAWQTASTIKLAFVAGIVSGSITGISEVIKWMMK